MESLALFFSASGRMAPRPFAGGTLAVYGAALVSLLLLSPPVLLRAGLAPFVLVQGLAIWTWFCLHAKRLRDAGRDIGPALAIVGLYALAIILLLLIVVLLTPSADVGEVGGSNALIPSDLVAMAAGDGDLGLFAYVIIGIFALIVVPVLVALGFSIWAGTRPAATREKS
jgi:uncharacterized membrane protein YhaH (DUF805 family)